jgi:hypothetical protein
MRLWWLLLVLWPLLGWIGWAWEYHMVCTTYPQLPRTRFGLWVSCVAVGLLAGPIALLTTALVLGMFAPENRWGLRFRR